MLWGEGGEGREWDGEMEVVEGREEVRVRGLKEGEGVGAGRSCFLEFATSYISPAQPSTMGKKNNNFSTQD